MKFLILAALVACVVTSAVSAQTYEYKSNYTALPITAVKELTIVGSINLSVNVTYQNFTVGPRLLFFENISKRLNINVSVPRKTPPGNYTSITQLVGPNKTMSTNLTFKFEIMNDTRYDSTAVVVDHNRYFYSECDYNLPKNITIEPKIVISGREGQRVQTTFDNSFFKVTDNFTIPSAGFVVADVVMTLKNLAPGNYKKIIDFSVSKNTNVTFEIHVLDCKAPYEVFKDDLYLRMIEMCNKPNATKEEIIACADLTKQFANKQYEAIIEASQERIVNNTVTKYVNYTERVPVLDLDDKSIVDAIKKIPVTVNSLISETREQQKIINENTANIETLRTSYDARLEEISKKTQEQLTPLIDDLNNKTDTISMYEEEYIKTSKVKWITILSLVTVLIVGFAINYYNENVWW